MYEAHGRLAPQSVALVLVTTVWGLLYLLTLFFFFSSRRRHTRFDCDWSSDVCSSDLLRHRQRAVPREGPDLQNPPCAHGEGHHLEEGGLQGAHHHLRTVLGAVGLS